MRFFCLLIFLLLYNNICSQTQDPGEYGFRYLQFRFRGDPVDILVRSRKGDESKPKPLLFFCQGSLPQPLMIFDKKQPFGVFPFNPDSLVNDYHLVITGKPFVPVSADISRLSKNYAFLDSTGKIPAAYTERNLLSYYVDRNIEVIRFLQKQEWVSAKALVLAGHSEGSTVAAKLAFEFRGTTALIYSGGNPLGRIMTILERARSNETNTTQQADEVLKNWSNIAAAPNEMSTDGGDSYRATWEFSIPPISYLEKLTIPVLVCYGTKDLGAAPFNDYLHIETIRQHKKNFSFLAYAGTEHNYFPVKADGSPDYTVFNWDKVAGDWNNWLKALH